MRYIIVDFYNGYATSNERKALAFDDDRTDDYIEWICENYLTDYAYSHAGDYIDRGDYYSDEDYEAALEEFIDGCEFEWYEEDYPEVIKKYNWIKI